MAITVRHYPVAPLMQQARIAGKGIGKRLLREEEAQREQQALAEQEREYRRAMEIARFGEDVRARRLAEAERQQEMELEKKKFGLAEERFELDKHRFELDKKITEQRTELARRREERDRLQQEFEMATTVADKVALIEAMLKTKTGYSYPEEVRLRVEQLRKQAQRIASAEDLSAAQKATALAQLYAEAIQLNDQQQMDQEKIKEHVNNHFVPVEDENGNVLGYCTVGPNGELKFIPKSQIEGKAASAVPSAKELADRFKTRLETIYGGDVNAMIDSLADYVLRNRHLPKIEYQTLMAVDPALVDRLGMTILAKRGGVRAEDMADAMKMIMQNPNTATEEPAVQRTLQDPGAVRLLIARPEGQRILQMMAYAGRPAQAALARALRTYFESLDQGEREAKFLNYVEVLEEPERFAEKLDDMAKPLIVTDNPEGAGWLKEESIKVPAWMPAEDAEKYKKRMLEAKRQFSTFEVGGKTLYVEPEYAWLVRLLPPHRQEILLKAALGYKREAEVVSQQSQEGVAHEEAFQKQARARTRQLHERLQKVAPHRADFYQRVAAAVAAHKTSSPAMPRHIKPRVWQQVYHDLLQTITKRHTIRKQAKSRIEYCRKAVPLLRQELQILLPPDEFEEFQDRIQRRYGSLPHFRTETRRYWDRLMAEYLPAVITAEARFEKQWWQTREQSQEEAWRSLNPPPPTFTETMLQSPVILGPGPM